MAVQNLAQLCVCVTSICRFKPLLYSPRSSGATLDFSREVGYLRKKKEFSILNKLFDLKTKESKFQGAVVIDKEFTIWNHRAVIPSNALHTVFITINLLEQKLTDVVKMAARSMNLSEDDSYGLMADKPKRFITDDNLNSLGSGFILTLCASPDHYVKRITEILTEGNNISQMENAVKTLDEFSLVRFFISIYQKNQQSKISIIMKILLQKYSARFQAGLSVFRFLFYLKKRNFFDKKNEKKNLECKKKIQFVLKFCFMLKKKPKFSKICKKKIMENRHPCPQSTTTFS